MCFLNFGCNLEIQNKTPCAQPGLTLSKWSRDAPTIPTRITKLDPFLETGSKYCQRRYTLYDNAHKKICDI